MNSNFLKERADKFKVLAKDAFEKEYYDLAAFNIEQAVQLSLKSAIYKILGDFPKTHDLFELLEQYKQVSNKEKEVDEIVEKYKRVINELNIAYITSRYIPSKFFKEQIEEMFKFLEELTNIL